MKPLVIEEAAELELVGSIAFYEERKAGLGLDFETAARQALETIVAAPERWPTGKRGTRRYVMSRFPLSFTTSTCPINFGSSHSLTRNENQDIGPKG
ncbi:MAG: hypothetical protein WA496_09285 [Candidatus Udaeobacter sp.]